MGLLKRVGFYLGGFALGLIILAFIFRGKDTQFCYSPNCRVLKNIRSKKIQYPDATKKDSLNINLILKEGNVIFSESDTKSSLCKTYVIEKGNKAAIEKISVKNCDSIAIIEYLD
jgi:hypothetical protein